MNANQCKRCYTRKALPAAESVFQLCARCGDAVFPGSDTVKYLELRVQYGR